MVSAASETADIGLPRSDAVGLWRGWCELVNLGLERITVPVEGMHRAIAARSLRWTGSAGAAARHSLDTIIARAYDAIRATGSALGPAIELGAAVAGIGSEPRPSSPRLLGSRVQAAVNAVWGDDLDQRGSELGIGMDLRSSDGEPLPLTPQSLAASFPSASPRVVVLVHGLGQTEACWQGRGAKKPVGLWDRLTTVQSLTTVRVRYNSGRHVSANGVELAHLLEQLTRCWPTPIDSMTLVGSSMGGLVIRSACHVGQAAGSQWMGAVTQLITLASPHLGAPLEKAANIVSSALRLTPESRPLAEFLDGRSVGIKDLRYGAIAEDEWPGADPEPLLRNTTDTAPQVVGVDHRFVASVITSDPTHPVGALLGDLMVRPRSGTGRGRRRQVKATEVRVLGGRRHSDLLHDHEVHEQVVAWLASDS